jgi:hypothetical protein
VMHGVSGRLSWSVDPCGHRYCVQSPVAPDGTWYLPNGPMLISDSGIQDGLTALA